MVVLVGLTAASLAFAVAPGGKLYIKARNTRLQKDASPTADVLKTLQPGTEVVWNGADAKDKKWHKVTAAGVNGVVFQANLSPAKPSGELLAKDNGKQIDPQAFATSGAATKALGDGPVAYGGKKGYKDSVEEILLLEAISGQISNDQLADHAKAAGINQVVGKGN